jgi:hypothetical protein
MPTKHFCDWCGKEIPEDKLYRIQGPWPVGECSSDEIICKECVDAHDKFVDSRKEPKEKESK